MNFCIPADENFKCVQVLPYVGTQYVRRNRWTATILILGESHYAEDAGAGEALGAEFTRSVVREVLKGAKKPALNFFARVAGLFYGGHRASKDERFEFWRSVAYYSYIQSCVGNSPRQRPTNRMWERAQVPFKETLQLLEPEFVLVLGRELWRRLPPWNEGDEISIRDGNDHRPARLYPRNNGHALVFGINHPSCWGWSYKKWEPWTKLAVNRAAKQVWRHANPQTR